ncbi:hypothetical protein Tco_1317208 [Tanacetum coccineum]
MTEVIILAKPTTATEPVVVAHNVPETYEKTTSEKRVYIDVEAKAIHMILSGIEDAIYSTVDACTTAKEMWIAIERLQQGESLNKQDVKTNLFWEFVTLPVTIPLPAYYGGVITGMVSKPSPPTPVITLPFNSEFEHPPHTDEKPTSSYNPSPRNILINSSMTLTRHLITFHLWNTTYGIRLILFSFTPFDFEENADDKTKNEFRRE